MSKKIETEDAELEALMADLEAQNTALMGGVATAAPVAEPVAEPEPVKATPPPAPVVVEPLVQESVVDRTRRLWIHHAESCAVFQGTAGDLEDDKSGELVEVSKLQAVQLLREYQAAKAAAKPVPEAKPEAKPEATPVKSEVKVELKAVGESPEKADGAPQTAVFVSEGIDVTGVVGTDTNANKVIQAPTEAVGPGGLKHYIDVDQFRRETRVSDTNLDQCMIEQNGLRAFYGAQAANAEAQASRLKARFEVVEATLYDKHRKALALTAEKTTEKMVDTAVKLDPMWLKAKNMLIESETIASINKSLVESLKDRRDMIIQLGADRRDEYKGAARVVAEQNERQDLKTRAYAAGRQGS